MPDEDLLSPAEVKALQKEQEANAFYRYEQYQQPDPPFISTPTEEPAPIAESVSNIASKAQLEDAEFINNMLGNIQPMIWPALLALSGFIVRTIVTKKKTRPIEFLLDCFAAVIIGAMVGIAIEDMHFSQNIRYAIIGVAGMVGPDLAGGVIILGQAFKESPTDFVLKHYRAFRGMKHESEKDKKSMTYEEWDKANKDFIDQTFSSPTDGNHEVAGKTDK